MLFNEALELVVKFVENHGVSDRQKEAAARVRKHWESGNLPAEENHPLVLVLQPNGDIEITGATAPDIKIDDRRAG